MTMSSNAISQLNYTAMHKHTLRESLDSIKADSVPITECKNRSACADNSGKIRKINDGEKRKKNIYYDTLVLQNAIFIIDPFRTG